MVVEIIFCNRDIDINLIEYYQSDEAPLELVCYAAFVNSQRWYFLVYRKRLKSEEITDNGKDYHDNRG